MMVARLLKVKARKSRIVHIGVGLLVIPVILVFLLLSTSRQAIISHKALNTIKQDLLLLPSNTQRIFQTVPYNPSTPQLATKNAHSRARSPPTNTTFTSNTESIKTFHAKKHQEWKEDALSRALRNVNKCMTASNFIAPALLETARQNAQLFMEHGTVWKCHFSTIS